MAGRYLVNLPEATGILALFPGTGRNTGAGRLANFMKAMEALIGVRTTGLFRATSSGIRLPRDAANFIAVIALPPFSAARHQYMAMGALCAADEMRFAYRRECFGDRL